MNKTLIVTVILLISGIVARAQCDERGSIKFERGQHSAVVSTKIGRARSVCYKLRAREGQEMTATLTSSAPDVTFRVVPDDFDSEPIVEQTTSWRGKLTSGSKYFISISAPRAGAAFTLKVTLH